MLASPHSQGWKQMEQKLHSIACRLVREGRGSAAAGALRGGPTEPHTGGLDSFFCEPWGQSNWYQESQLPTEASLTLTG